MTLQTNTLQTTIRHLHLDPIGGIAGDMFLAAALDAFPDFETVVLSAMREAGLPEDWLLEKQAAKDKHMVGSRFAVVPPDSGKSRPTGNFRDIKRMLESSKLTEAVQLRAIQIFELLAEAESHAHGVPVEEVHFHELADWDSVSDIVGAACVIELFPQATWSVGPIPMGSGRVRTSHGPMPVPAPATTQLLKGFELIDDGVSGERVTPTGAAILKALKPSTRVPQGRWCIEASGQGFGTKVFPELANMLRLVAYSPSQSAVKSSALIQEKIAVIRFEVDDQSPEDLAIALRLILKSDWVKDVCQWPVYAKKGRLASSVQVLCHADAVTEVAELCLLQTTSIGLRYRIEDRLLLERSEQLFSFDNEQLRVKRVLRPDAKMSFKLEADELEKYTQTQLERAELRRLLEGKDDDGS